jgi:predicted MFS family arabinose efflux permease
MLSRLPSAAYRLFLHLQKVSLSSNSPLLENQEPNVVPHTKETTPAIAAPAESIAPERRGLALAVVFAGLSGATALGAPIGTLVGSAGDWRSTMWFVAAPGLLAATGIMFILPAVPPAPALTLRLAPLGDARVVPTLVASFLVIFGEFLIYTYSERGRIRTSGLTTRVPGFGASAAVLSSGPMPLKRP